MRRSLRAFLIIPLFAAFVAGDGSVEQTNKVSRVKQTQYRCDGQCDADEVHAGDFFAEGECADERAQCDDADVHACEYEGWVVAEALVGADVKPDVGEVERAQ